MVKGLTTIDKAIVVLEKTRDGDDLDPKLLGLVELAVNDRLNDEEHRVFKKFYEEVESGTYKRLWFHAP